MIMIEQSSVTERNRLREVMLAPLSRSSLVGSWFHSDKDRQWQGCVVAEPSPGIYLVEIAEWLTGEMDCQRLVRIGDMLDWQFYDTISWMRNTYEHGQTPWTSCGEISAK
jgi:hypothetical protein